MSRRNSTAEKQLYRTGADAQYLTTTQENFEFSDVDTLHIPLKEGFVVQDTGESFPVPHIIRESDPLSRLGKSTLIPMPLKQEKAESGGFLRRIPGADPAAMSRTRKISFAFALAVLVSFAGSYALHVMRSPSVEAVPVATVAAPEILVSAEDPQMAAEKLQAGAISAPVDVFNPGDQTSLLNIDLGERALSFVSEPRLAGAGASRQPLMQRASSSKPGIHPTLSAGRYTSPSGLEWQGAWELNNPRGNLARADKYMRYLEDTFKRNMNDSLVAQRSGALDISSGFDASRKAVLPSLKSGR